MLLGDTAAKVWTSPINLTRFTRPFLLVRGRGLGVRLQAIMHYLLHMCMYVYKRMHAYLCKAPKGDVPLLLFVGQKLLHNKCMVSFALQASNLSSVENSEQSPSALR